jgi:hypothetical protein
MQRSEPWKLSWLPPLIAAALLSGCATPVSNPGGCAALSLKTYTADFNTELAAEVDLASPAAIWPLAVVDYVGLRDQVKACQR